MRTEQIVFNRTAEHNRKDKMRKEFLESRYLTRNGLSIDTLHRANCVVKITHMRYGYRKGSHGVDILGIIPSFMRQHYDFTSFGGETHIFIKTPSNRKIRKMSICSLDDNFDYSMGVKIALEKIGGEDLIALRNLGS